MKKGLNVLGTLLFALVLGLTVVSCDNGSTKKEPTYTVWTDTTSYSNFTSAFSGVTLNDGYYIRYELPSSGWNTISPTLTDEEKHVWTESQINNYFIGRGFGAAEAKQETSWLITINHGFLASRSESVVYMLLK